MTSQTILFTFCVHARACYESVVTKVSFLVHGQSGRRPVPAGSEGEGLREE